MTRTGSKLARDSLVYVFGTGWALPAGLINIAVLTRLLAESQYGELAILTTLAGLLSVALTLVTLRGTIMVGFGGDAETGGGADEEAVTDHTGRAMTTGLVLTAVIAALGGLVMAGLSGPLAVLLLHNRSEYPAIIWAGAAGAAGAVWRLVSNVIRMERRTVSFSLINGARPMLVLSIVTTFVVIGWGPTGAIAGTALGTVLASAVAIGYSAFHGTYGLAFSRSDAREVWRRGLPVAGVLIGLWALHDSDVLVLAHGANSAEVGVYRLASRVTSLLSYAVSAFVMAWSALERSPLFRAAYKAYGQYAVRGEMLFYYLVITVGLLLGLVAISGPLLGALAPSYNIPQSYIAVTGAGYLMYGAMIIIAHGSKFARRYLVYGIAAMSGGACVIVLGLATVSSLGAYGVALGNVVGAALAIAIIFPWAARTGGYPELNWARLGPLLAIGALCWTVISPLAAFAGDWQPAVALLGVALYPALIIVTRIVPSAHRRILWNIVVGIFARRSGAARPLLDRMGELPMVPRCQLLAAVELKRRRVEWPVDAAGSAAGFVGALRALIDLGTTGPQDASTGRYLLSTGSVAQRDLMARAIFESGMPADELVALEDAFVVLCAAPRRAWRRAQLDPSTGGLPTASLDPALDPDAVSALRSGAESLSIPPSGAPDASTDHVRVIRDVRRLARLGGDRRHDRLIGAFLLADRDEAPTPAQLWDAGVDPLELHRFERVVEEIASLSRRRGMRRRLRPRRS